MPVRRRVKALVLKAETVDMTPLLLAGAVMMIALFTVSLAMAEPRNAAIMASQGETTGRSFDRDGGLTSDIITGDEAAILSRPLHPPRYPDRFEFYHRYDYGMSSRYRPDTGRR